MLSPVLCLTQCRRFGGQCGSDRALDAMTAPFHHGCVVVAICDALVGNEPALIAFAWHVRMALENATRQHRSKSIFGMKTWPVVFLNRRKVEFASKICWTFGPPNSVLKFCCSSLTSCEISGVVDLAGHASLPIKDLNWVISSCVNGFCFCRLLAFSMSMGLTLST